MVSNTIAPPPPSGSIAFVEQQHHGELDFARRILTTQRIGDQDFTIDEKDVEGLHSLTLPSSSELPILFALPDCPPSDKTSSLLLISALDSDCTDLRRALLAEEGSVSGESSVRSNVGGFHSVERPVFEVVIGSDGAKCVSVGPPSPLHKVGDSIASALRSVLSPSSPPTVVPIPLPSSPPPPSPPPGSLLLRTQARRFHHDYYYVSVTPDVGRVVVFQGYMPHAVMPLVMGGGEGVVVETEGDGGCTDGASQPRISLAFNISITPSSPSSSFVAKVSGWYNVNRSGDYNALHDHEGYDYSAVVYC